MVYTEIQVKKGKKYYYMAHTTREKNKFKKFRIYLGKELSKDELADKEEKAQEILQKKFNKIQKQLVKTPSLKELAKRNLYKQSGAGVAIAISLPMNTVMFTKEVFGGLKNLYPEDMIYSSPDHQFFHYFSAEKIKKAADALFKEFENDKEWMNNRITRFEKTVEGFKELGNILLQEAETFSSKNKEKLIKLFEQFLQKDYDYWVQSIFIDLFDPFEKEIIDFIFKEKASKISKEDLQLLLLPDKSTFWDEKQEFLEIHDYIQKNKLDKTDRIVWKKLTEHARKYWWIENDYQIVKRLGASDFLKKLDEPDKNQFWRDIPKNKKKIITRYSLDKETIERLNQFTKMAYLRDIRKKYTQIANYFIVNFFHIIAGKLNIPVEWSNFLVSFWEYKKFINKDRKLLKELELRTRKGVWTLVGDVQGKFSIETEKADEIFNLIESKIKGGSIIYGSVACLGKAIGTAKVILRQSDFSKFKEGDILVTGMTRPEFVPLMKIASAIVTDEGGITCHAAIISRELNKPCVIGTQTATKVLKDGDNIEVNAHHGFVKLLEGKK